MTDSSASKKEGKVSRTDPPSYTNSPIVTVTVGKNRKQYHIHQALLVAHPKYFQGCFNSGFVESTILAPRLTEDQEQDFDWFVRWLYGHDLDLTTLKNPIDPVKRAIDLYALADKLMSDGFQNAIIDETRAKYEEIRQISPLRYVVEISSRGLLQTCFGKFLAQMAAWKLQSSATGHIYMGGPDSGNVNKSEEATRDILCDDHEAAVAVLRRIARPDVNSWDDLLKIGDCEHHKHDDGEVCKPLKTVQTKSAQTQAGQAKDKQPKGKKRNR